MKKLRYYLRYKCHFNYQDRFLMVFYTSRVRHPSIIMALCYLFISTSVIGQTVNQQKNVSVKEILDLQEKSSQTIEKMAENKSADIPFDKFERGQPRSAIAGYLLAMRSGDLSLASEYLDYRNISEKTLAIGKEELARQLYVVLNRQLWVDLSNVSDHQKGNVNDGLPRYRESIGSVMVKEKQFSILMQRVPRKSDRVKIWKISNATVEKIPFLFEEFSYSPLGEWLAKRLPKVDFYGVMLWQWLYFTLMLFCTYIASYIGAWLLVRLIKRIYPNTSSAPLAFIKGPVAFLFAVIFSRNLIDSSNVTLAVKAIMEGSTILIIAWCWVCFRFVDLLKVILAEKFVAQDKPLAVYLLRPAGTVTKLLMVIFASLIWLENLGFNASTLLAGLGIGGLALALAAQKTVENMIGAITLYTSAPVKIGNFCRFGQNYGVVEEIGLRSTRIRTLDRTVIYVANARFIDMDIENFSERERIAFRPKILLTPQCTRENINNFLDELKAHLQHHEKIANEPLRAHFKAYTEIGLELNILAYVNTTDFDEYLDEINELNLTILSLLDQHQCPLQVVNDRGLISV